MSHRANDLSGWKVLLYMGSGDTGNFERIQNAVLDAIAATNVENVQLVYQFARHERVERGLIYKKQRKILSTSPPIEIIDPAHLTSFLDWAAENFPSRNTALFAKDHAQGALDTTAHSPTVSLAHPDHTRHSAAKSVRVETASGIFLEGKRYMPMPSFQRAVENSRAGRVDLLGLDACKLGSIEVAYELRHAATVLVASEMPVVTTGWDYPAVLTYLDKQDAVTPRDLACEVIKVSKKFKLIALELAWVELVAEKISALAQELNGHMNNELAAWIRNNLPQVYSDGLPIEKLVKCQGLCQASTLTAITDALSHARVLPDPSTDGLPTVGLYFPTTKGSKSIASYGSGAFAVDTGWAEFLGALNHLLMTTSTNGVPPT